MRLTLAPPPLPNVQHLSDEQVLKEKRKPKKHTPLIWAAKILPEWSTIVLLWKTTKRQTERVRNAEQKESKTAKLGWTVCGEGKCSGDVGDP